MTVGAVSVCVIAAAGVSPPPAQADTVTAAQILSSKFKVSALNNARVGYSDPANAVQLGQSICPLLAQPGGSFARAASSIANNGISPEMAEPFTRIAISAYCPSMVSSIANGDLLNGGNLPGLPFGTPGLPTQ